jgi:hypothetical protein
MAETKAGSGAKPATRMAESKPAAGAETKTDKPAETSERAGRHVDVSTEGVHGGPQGLPAVPDNTVDPKVLQSGDYLATHGHNPQEANTGDF